MTQTDDIQEFLKSKGAMQGVKSNYLNTANLDDLVSIYMIPYAAAYGDLKLLKCLNIRGQQINGYDYDGRTALGLACSEGHLDIVQYLVTHGADINHMDARGNDALADTVRENRKDDMEYLNSKSLNGQRSFSID